MSEKKLEGEYCPEKIYFSDKHAEVYCYRKDTPTELIEKILDYLKEKIPEPLETAADVGCGSGQSTVILAPYFKQVHGMDVSAAQIRQAEATRSLPNISYGVCPAEELPLKDGSVQLLTAATSMHWFKVDLFLTEVRRVLCDNGVLAVYGYMSMKPDFGDPEVEAQLDRLYAEFSKPLRPYHVSASVEMFKNKYKDVNFPFEEVVRCPDVRCHFEGRFGYGKPTPPTGFGFQVKEGGNPIGDRRAPGDFQKRLYEIGATFKRSPEDTVTLYRDYQLTLCRKTNK
ncbi:methyltransferase DDB_G0268948 [Trichonephila inaurata madagascariensis]|uniref:Methyltransferase DDB_G0268948 n=1 Tax=Trichonephila inaurata madagascariensis TaxID=2747483 RepID=A0A8X6YF90_9ARAC|nr:methyltransferase DDB_G0268948 [Trichonephila inaurata madagascariensis]